MKNANAELDGMWIVECKQDWSMFMVLSIQNPRYAISLQQTKLCVFQSPIIPY